MPPPLPRSVRSLVPGDGVPVVPFVTTQPAGGDFEAPLALSFMILIWGVDERENRSSETVRMAGDCLAALAEEEVEARLQGT